MTTSYHFDTLPVRPQPQPFESLSGYLTRLAEANHIRYSRTLFKLGFPDEKAKLTLNTGDFPPHSFGTLPTLVQCSAAKLLTTTFYHLGRKFGRVLEPLPLAQFLSGAIAPQLRYCPDCLAERGYYSLLWRFLMLEGCPDHDCQLLDRCGHCGQSVPLLANIPKLAVCPACAGDLSRCQAARLPTNLRQRVQTRFADLAQLVSPQPYEVTSEPITRMIGQRFENWRQVRQLKVADVAEGIGQPLEIIYHIETGPTHRGVKFQWYVDYTDYLHLNLPDIFQTPAPEPLGQTYEEKLLTKIRQAVDILEQQGQPITQEIVAEMIGISCRSMSRYSEIRALWAAYRATWQQQREQALVDEIQQAIDTLKQQGKRISYTAVSRMVGLSRESVKRYHPSAWQLLASEGQYTAKARFRSAAMESPRPLYQREQTLVTEVQQAITQLQQQGQPVRQRAISNIVGLSPTSLRYYPRVRAILQANNGHSPPRNEDELITEIQAALVSLEATGTHVTRKAIGALIGLSPHTLMYYPRVKAFLTEHVSQKAQEHRARHRQQREAELVVKVQQAIETLTVGEQPLTQKAVCETVEMSSVNLKRYPRVKRLLQQHNLVKNSG